MAIENQAIEAQARETKAAEQELLARFSSLMDGLADMYGQHCELALYALTAQKQPLLKAMKFKAVKLKTVNRRMGSPDALSPELAQHIKELSTGPKSHVTYFTQDQAGAPIKSHLQLLMDANAQPLGLLCIHLHLSAPFYELLGDLLPKSEVLPLAPSLSSAVPSIISPKPPVVNHGEITPENFNNNVEELVTLTVERTIEGISADGLVANHLKNKHIVTTLYEKGIFDIKDAIAMVSNKLNISKHTVYLYIRQKKRDDEELSPSTPEIS